MTTQISTNTSYIYLQTISLCILSNLPISLIKDKYHRFRNTMPPIRVGLIGLSGAPPDKYEGTSWTANAHLPYLKSSPDYKIVALLNSSAESARAAIARYELPSETRAYGDPEGIS